jgi:hypothetical protein
METYGGVDVWIHVLLISALDGGDWSSSRTGRFTPGSHWIGGWVGPRTGLDAVEKKESVVPIGKRTAVPRPSSP